MKKLMFFTLALVMLLNLTACGAGGGIELTTDNIKEYVSIKASVVDSEVEKDSGSVGGLYYKNYEGEATVKLEVVNQSGAKFENVSIVCEVYTFPYFNADGPTYGWEFKSGNKQYLNNVADSENYKSITITLPYDGNWSTTENLELVMYTETSKIPVTPSELSTCYVRIVSVSGTAKK